MQGEFPWSTARDFVRVTLTLRDEADGDGSPTVRAVLIQRLDDGPVTSGDMHAVAEAFDSQHDSVTGAQTQLGLLDEFIAYWTSWRSQRIEHRLSVDELSGLDDDAREFARREGMTFVSAYEAPHPEVTAVHVRSARPRRSRVRWSDEVLQDVAHIVTHHPDDWVDVLMRNYGWTSRQNVWRIKGEAVKKGYLPPVEDGRGRKKGKA